MSRRAAAWALCLAACGPGGAVLPAASGDTATTSSEVVWTDVGSLHVAPGDAPQGAPDVGVRGNGRALIAYDDGPMLRAIVLEPDDTTAATSLALNDARDAAVAAHPLGWTLALTLAGDELLASTEIDLFGTPLGSVLGLSIFTPLRPAIAWLETDEPLVVASDDGARLGCSSFGDNILTLEPRMCPTLADPSRRVGHGATTATADGYAVVWTELADDGRQSVHLADTLGHRHHLVDHHGGSHRPPDVLADAGVALVTWHGRDRPDGPATGWIARVDGEGPGAPRPVATDEAPALAGPWEGHGLLAWIDDDAVRATTVDLATGIPSPTTMVLAEQPGATLEGLALDAAIGDDGGLRWVVAWVADDGSGPRVGYRGGRLTRP